MVFEVGKLARTVDAAWEASERVAISIVLADLQGSGPRDEESFGRVKWQRTSALGSIRCVQLSTLWNDQARGIRWSLPRGAA